MLNKEQFLNSTRLLEQVRAEKELVNETIIFALKF